MRAAEIFRPAIIRNCPGLILCHNHPSGDPAPSPEDRSQVTRCLIGITPTSFFINPDLLALAQGAA
jgi:DNA repair protein RadC